MKKDTDTTHIIFNSEHKNEEVVWYAVNDNVMGGVSEGGALLNEDNCTVFSGMLSFDNNGGFSSIRTTITDGELSGFKGLRIRVKGDGRSYQLRLRGDGKFDGIAFKHDFTTVKNEWIELDFPISSFVPTYRGRILQDVEAIAASEIKQLGFLIADKAEGTFKLIVDEIVAFK